MQTINNKSGNNHLHHVRLTYLNSDEILIVSPFLSEDLSFFPFNELTHLRKITLITRLKPFTADQFQKVEFLLCLYEFSQNHDIELEVLIDNFLHAKVYVSLKNGQYVEGVVTSANFNRHGFIINNEWGVALTDPIEISAMVAEMRKYVFLEPLSLHTVQKMKQLADRQPRKSREKEAGLDLSKLLDVSNNPLHVSSKTTYWLKPIGVTDNPIPWGEPFGHKEYPLHFARRPSGVRIGDIMIAYAIGHGNVLSVYEINSGINKVNDEEDRWPYYMMGKNLIPHYGEEWFKHDFDIYKQRVLALKTENFNVTPSGKNSFGRMNFGGDKMRLTTEFANYVIQKTMVINKEISERLEPSADL
jgi:hypothetical protein